MKVLNYFKNIIKDVNFTKKSIKNEFNLKENNKIEEFYEINSKKYLKKQKKIKNIVKNDSINTKKDNLSSLKKVTSGEITNKRIKPRENKDVGDVKRKGCKSNEKIKSRKNTLRLNNTSEEEMFIQNMNKSGHNEINSQYSNESKVAQPIASTDTVLTTTSENEPMEIISEISAFNVNGDKTVPTETNESMPTNDFMNSTEASVGSIGQFESFPISAFTESKDVISKPSLELKDVLSMESLYTDSTNEDNNINENQTQIHDRDDNKKENHKETMNTKHNHEENESKTQDLLKNDDKNTGKKQNEEDNSIEKKKKKKRKSVDSTSNNESFIESTKSLKDTLTKIKKKSKEIKNDKSNHAKKDEVLSQSEQDTSNDGNEDKRKLKKKQKKKKELDIENKVDQRQSQHISKDEFTSIDENHGLKDVKSDKKPFVHEMGTSTSINQTLTENGHKLSNDNVENKGNDISGKKGKKKNKKNKLPNDVHLDDNNLKANTLGKFKDETTSTKAHLESKATQNEKPFIPINSATSTTDINKKEKVTHILDSSESVKEGSKEGSHNKRKKFLIDNDLSKSDDNIKITKSKHASSKSKKGIKNHKHSTSDSSTTPKKKKKQKSKNSFSTDTSSLDKDKKSRSKKKNTKKSSSNRPDDDKQNEFCFTIPIENRFFSDLFTDYNKESLNRQLSNINTKLHCKKCDNLFDACCNCGSLMNKHRSPSMTKKINCSIPKIVCRTNPKKPYNSMTVRKPKVSWQCKATTGLPSSSSSDSNSFCKHSYVNRMICID